MTVGHSAWHELSTVPEPALGPLAGDASADVIVVGLGASGLAACQRAATRGADVLGVDAIGIAAGAAGANGGFLLAGLAAFHHDAVARYGRQQAVRAYRWTLDLLDEETAAEPSARRVGSLRLAASTDEEADIRAQHAALAADGLPGEPYTGPEGVGLLVPTDAVVDPVSRCRRLAAAAVAAGARLHAPAPVAAVTPDAAVLADGTRVAARHVVVAVDGGLEVLVPAAQVRTARLQMAATATTTVTRVRPEYRRWGYDYVQQLPTGHVLVGGGRDLEGAACWGAPPVPTATVQAHLDAELARLGIDAPVTHRWAAQAAFTDDLLPVADTLDGVHVVGGYCGHGNLLGPALARRAVDAALDAVPLRWPGQAS